MEWVVIIVIGMLCYDLGNLLLSEKSHGKIRDRLVSEQLAGARHVGCMCGNVSEIHSNLSAHGVEARKNHTVHSTETHKSSPGSEGIRGNH